MLKPIARLAVIAALCFAAVPLAACSRDTACQINTGSYHIALPDDVLTPRPAVVFLHGFGGSGSGVMRNHGMINAMLIRGYAVVAPTGMQMQGRSGGSWSFHPDRPQRRDEVAFLTAVRDDIVARHNVDADRILLSGFSIGGSMTAYLACAAPETFRAYAPLGGNFWRPHPERCAGPVRMLHTHGWMDGTVPLEGRVLRGADSRDPNALIQGDVFQALSIWRETNRCFQLKADRFETTGIFMRRAWDRCAPGSALEFALFPGGHIIPTGWADMVLDWFEGL
ncbi:alpha/beta fold hydrolase [Marivita sp. S6314]|uniref:alpha/beta hydrolase family esterase n=1 Tax=Marivita sp. S6314 TaxID=2926406 RepID=UPI001FF2E957|nr:alpha/beta fold hydrolase [Marivita sp. S6314]MCK0150348.1 alpha/beta fold hydrolase [Marivita sp. S6314]